MVSLTETETETAKDGGQASSARPESAQLWRLPDCSEREEMAHEVGQYYLHQDGYICLCVDSDGVLESANDAENLCQLIQDGGKGRDFQQPSPYDDELGDVRGGHDRARTSHRTSPKLQAFSTTFLTVVDSKIKMFHLSGYVVFICDTYVIPMKSAQKVVKSD